MTKMTHTEKRAVLSLSGVMSLRMIGLFMVLPLFAIYATQLPFATDTLVGLAIGVYGLSQAIFQIPFGALSDKFGRKPVITFGLIIFIFGSLLAASAHSIYILLIGRTLQGIGAVGGSLLALVADLTRENQRTKAMALAGISIGASFTLAMVIGPLLTKWFAINQLFYIAALCGVVAIAMLYTLVPPAPTIKQTEDNKTFWALLQMPELLSLNFGILVLHAIFTATFVVLPINLLHLAGINTQSQWHFYVPALFIACFVSLFCMGYAERKDLIKPFFLSGIFAIACAIYIFWDRATNISDTFFALSLFFSGFSLLEAFLPSMVSRAAPAQHKGSALGLYSCAQFCGIFIGGSLGGWLHSQFNFSGVYLFCLSLSFVWFIIALFTRKLERKQQPDFIALKEQLQSE